MNTTRVGNKTQEKTQYKSKGVMTEVSFSRLSHSDARWNARQAGVELGKNLSTPETRKIERIFIEAYSETYDEMSFGGIAWGAIDWIRDPKSEILIKSIGTSFRVTGYEFLIRFSINAGENILDYAHGKYD